MTDQSRFTVAILAMLCAYEQAKADADPGYFGEDGIKATFTAVPTAGKACMLKMPLLHPDVNSDTGIDVYAITDQFGGHAGYAEICDGAATFAYSLVTG